MEKQVKKSNLVRCDFKDDLDRVSTITSIDRTTLLKWAWEHFKETSKYKHLMLGL